MDDKTTAHNVSETLTKLYFELNGFFVYTNSSGKAEFDMIISKDKDLFSVEVKSVSVPKTSTLGTYFDVQLKSTRSNKTVNTTINFSTIGLDYLAVVNLQDNSIAVFDASELTSKTTGMRVYLNKFIKII